MRYISLALNHTFRPLCSEKKKKKNDGHNVSLNSKQSAFSAGNLPNRISIYYSFIPCSSAHVFINRFCALLNSNCLGWGKNGIGTRLVMTQISLFIYKNNIRKRINLINTNITTIFIIITTQPGCNKKTLLSLKNKQVGQISHRFFDLSSVRFRGDEYWYRTTHHRAKCNDLSFINLLDITPTRSLWWAPAPTTFLHFTPHIWLRKVSPFLQILFWLIWSLF